jgi:hypothetical protein
VSEKTARNIASFLSERGIEIESVTAQTINGKAGASPAGGDKAEEAPKEQTKKFGVCDSGGFGIAGLIASGAAYFARQRWSVPRGHKEPAARVRGR